MPTTSRRVSYILPSPPDPPPLLTLPPLGQSRNGQTAPLLLPKSEPSYQRSSSFASRNPFLSPPSTPIKPEPSHPRHCLGITSLALDTSTVLANSSAPGGILYTGGRDGLVASWELGVTHKRRKGARYETVPGRGGRVRWERIGDGAELWDDDDDEDVEFDEDYEEAFSSEDEEVGDGWVGVDGDRVREGVRKRRAGRGEVAYEDRWEVDHQEIAMNRPPPTTFRQSAQTHTDWVNSLLLCNLNQTVITASSDRTIRAWSPHDTTSQSPALIGKHRDYVRALAWAKFPSLLFSGALDRTLSIWDVQSPKPDTPLLSIDLNKSDDSGGVGLEGERGSVYALGVDPAGRMLAAGTPERVVRLWDPRVGEKSVGKLVGHTDCVRSVVVSDDGRYMLTGSADTTIKLWSLAAHRCLHTFNHHTSSIWALHSNHPNLERFYSGSRDGHLCVVDVEQCTDIADGECVVLAREGGVPIKGDYESKTGDEGIRSIVGMDDEYVWTATGSAEIRRWRDVGRRVSRLDNYDGTSYGDRSGMAATVTSALGSAFQPVPITDGRSKRYSLEPTDSQNPLAQVDSQDTRSVAFAPTASPRDEKRTQDNQATPMSQIERSAAVNLSPGSAASPSAPALPASLRERLNPPGQRRTTFSGASVAGSFMSESSVNGDDGALLIPGHSKLLNGIPYESLVCLGLPDSPYSFGFSQHRQEEHDVHSGASITSVPRGLSTLLKAGGGDESLHHRGSTQFESEQSQAQIARMRFEDREVASEAVPLRSKPDEVIAGRNGLIRALILNDRQHVLTLDTEGQVAVWNIIRGVCVGRFTPDDIAAALDLERGVGKVDAEVMRRHTQEVLELVKERIEGETMVITWCQVDTKIGSLTVHLEEGRVFDAEVYADELGLESMEGIKEDARINLGKWALANLFKGLIKAEEKEVREVAASISPSTTISSLPSITRAPAPTHIVIDRPMVAPPHRTRSNTGSFSGGMTPAITIPGLATPAATPAVLPDVSLPLASSAPASAGWLSVAMANRTSNLSSIPQSPAGPGLGSGSGSQFLQSPAHDSSTVKDTKDYFSVKKNKDTSPNRDATNGEKDKATSQTSSGSTTPGGSFMGKFKGFGKKKGPQETPMSTVVETVQEAPEEDTPKVPDREAAQMHILDTVRSHAFHPPPPWEAPPLSFPPSTSLLISEEAKDAGAWAVTYRSQVSSTERDMEALEMNSPLWLLDYLFTSRIKNKDPVKLTFVLEPAPGGGLKPMPEGTARLSASRVLRAKKIMAFIYDKLELGPSRARSGSVTSTHTRSIGPAGRKQSLTTNQTVSPTSPHSTQVNGGASSINGDDDTAPEDVIELVCGASVIDPKITLATLKQYYGSGGDMVLNYRLKHQV